MEQKAISMTKNNEYAQVLFRANEDGSTSLVQWDGPPFALVSRSLLQQIKSNVTICDAFDLCGVRVRVIDIEPVYDAYVVCRVTRFAWFFLARHRLKNLLRWINARVIWTLAVWELAESNPAEYPHWGWVTRRWKKVYQSLQKQGGA